MMTMSATELVHAGLQSSHPDAPRLALAVARDYNIEIPAWAKVVKIVGTEITIRAPKKTIRALLRAPITECTVVTGARHSRAHARPGRRR